MLVCNVTCPDTLATSYSAVAAREAGAVAERRKKAKYAHLEPSHHFAHITVDSDSGQWTRMLLVRLAQKPLVLYKTSDGTL